MILNFRKATIKLHTKFSGLEGAPCYKCQKGGEEGELNAYLIIFCPHARSGSSYEMDLAPEGT